eukprot:362873_1
MTTTVISDSSCTTRSRVLEIHKNRLEKGYVNDNNASSLLATIGGIDEVINVYLSHSDIILTDNQIHQIHELITTDDHQTIAAPIHNDEDHLYCKSKDGIVPILLLDPNDTFLNALFEEKYARKIEHFLYSKSTILMMGLAQTVWTIIEYLYLHEQHNIVYPLFSVFLFPPTAAFFILCILSVNRTTTRLVLKTFEFWIKMFYMFCWLSSNFVFYYIMNADKFSYIALWRAMNVMLFFSFTTFIGFVGLFDGLPRLKWFKIAMGAVSSVYFLYLSFKAQFLSYSHDGRDESIVRIYGNLQFSVISMLARSTRILFIFCFKHWIFTIYNQYNGNAVSITIKPILQWKAKEKDSNHIKANNTAISRIKSVSAPDVEIIYAENDDIQEEIDANAAQNLQLDNNEQSETESSNASS